MKVYYIILVVSVCFMTVGTVVADPDNMVAFQKLINQNYSVVVIEKTTEFSNLPPKDQTEISRLTIKGIPPKRVRDYEFVIQTAGRRDVVDRIRLYDNGPEFAFAGKPQIEVFDVGLEDTKVVFVYKAFMKTQAAVFQAGQNGGEWVCLGGKEANEAIFTDNPVSSRYIRKAEVWLDSSGDWNVSIHHLDGVAGPNARNIDKNFKLNIDEGKVRWLPIGATTKPSL